ncbi:MULTISPECIES: hypothetical protein [unclassified Nocardia]|uniref:hypothetical protein n=1 Tax=unclassified Nocardia TaxID=2637762 RepID=UPI001C4EC7B4|nr:hypothetical protein [Nocardia sp. MH4]
MAFASVSGVIACGAPEPSSPRDEIGFPTTFNPCTDVSAALRGRHHLDDPELASLSQNGRMAPASEASASCTYASSGAIGQDYTLQVAASSDWIPGLPKIGTREFRAIQVSGRAGEIGCVTEAVYDKPYCDLVVPQSKGKIWFSLRFDLPQGDIETSRSATEGKLIELASEIATEFPPD